MEQVVLSHSHSNHCTLLPRIREAFHPKVFPLSPCVSSVDCLLGNGDSIRMGDRDFEVIHTPGHGSDSICLNNEAERALFGGDSPLLITSPSPFDAGSLTAPDKLCAREIRRIDFGHGAPLTERTKQRLRESRRLASTGVPACESQLTRH